MLRRCYDRLLALAGSPRARWWLAAIAFAESSFFPLPPDPLLVAMVVSRPRRAWQLPALCTLTSVCGGALGYLIGYALFARLAEPLLRLYHYDAAFTRFQQLYAEYGFWVILVKGLTPIPYKIVTIASGAAHFSFPLFVIASLLTRGARFFLLAALLRRYGDAVRGFTERWLTWVTTALAIVTIGGLLLLRLV